MIKFMLAQINDLPSFELTHWVWIGVGFLALFVFVCTIISCKKVTDPKEENDPMNEELRYIAGENCIRIKSPNGQINCTHDGVEQRYTFVEAFRFAESHPYFLFQYIDDNWMSRSDFFMNYNFKDHANTD